MNKILVILLLGSGWFFPANAQNISAAQYIAQYKDLAIKEMKRMGVPAAITLAQGLLESQSGNSDLVKESNNHFGIKCKSTWTSEFVKHDDDEPGECFRKYKTAEDSYRDHSNFLRGSSRYDFLFQLNPADYKAWAYGLLKAGYATNPRYPEILIKNIETNNLQQYTMEGIGEMPHFDASKFQDDPVNKSSEISNDDTNLTAPINLSINGSKALLVPKGTSLLAIATQYHINLDKLLTINDLTKDGLLGKDQYVFLEKKQKEGKDNFYISQPNESMYDIAQKNGVILQYLYNYNQISPDDFIVAGTKIFLKPQQVSAMRYQPSTISSRSQTSNQKVNNSETGDEIARTHEVLPKENLYSISKKYGVSVENLRTWNNLSSDYLQPGQQLIISK